MTEHTEAPGAECDLIPVRAEARRLYESTDMSFDAVAAEVNISARTVKKWSAQDGYWQKQHAPVSVADRARRMAELAENLQPELAAPVAPSAAVAVAESDPREVEAKLKEKHQRQWRVIDGLSAEAVRNRDPRAASVAFTLARTFATAQRSERIAYGLGTGETSPATVVLERE